MSQTPVVVMTGAREGEVDLSKSNKIDKTGEVTVADVASETTEGKINPYQNDLDGKMMRINAAEHYPRNDYEYIYKNAKNSYPGFVSAMDDE